MINHPEIDQNLIYTGADQVPTHVKTRDCEYKTGWEFSAVEIVFWEKYFYNGKLIQENAHKYTLPRATSITLSDGQLNAG